MPRVATIKSIQRSDWGIAAGVFVLALAVRLLFLFSHADADWPHSIYYEGDAPEWVRWAQSLEGNQPYEFDLPMRSPGVAYVLAWVDRPTDFRNHEVIASSPVLGGPFVRFKVMWCLLSAATCSLAYLGFALVIQRRLALIATGLSIFYFGSYVTSTSLNNEVPYGFCLFAVVLLMLQMVNWPVWWRAGLIALLHGLAMLLRAEHPLFMLAMTAWLVWRWRQNVPAERLPWRQTIAWSSVIIAGSIALCVPWSIRGAAATRQFNSVTTDTIDFNAVRLPNAPPDFPPVKWTPEAQAAINSLPAFARRPNVYQLTLMVLQQHRAEVTASDVDMLFSQHFHYRPEPLKSWALLSIKGPLDFALANHQDAGGVFAKSALLLPGDSNPQLHLAHPDHLYLLNHGYAAGWKFITSDFGTWLKNVGRKVAVFSDGITLGYTADNLPIGPYGPRRAIDVMTAEPGRFIPWKTLVLGLLAWGIGLAVVRRIGGLWLVVLACKVIITILFYGYARQAVSVFPAFAIFIALPVDQVIDWIGQRVRFANRIRWIAVGVIIAALFVADLVAWWSPKGQSIAGPIEPTPQWGERAFECTEPLVIKPASTKP